MYFFGQNVLLILFVPVTLSVDTWVGHSLVSTRLTRRAGLRRSRPWYELKRDIGPSPGLRGKTELFQKKMKKYPKSGSGCINPTLVIC